MCYNVTKSVICAVVFFFISILKGTQVLKRKAFTLIELLVVISIIAMLLAILMPALNVAREQARRAVCSVNIRTLGIGLRMYEETNDMKLPPQYNTSGSHSERESYRWSEPGNTMNPWKAYIGFQENYTQGGKLIPVQLAKLYATKMIDTSEVYYCPSQGNRKHKQEQRYSWEYYTSEGPWGHIPKSLWPNEYLVRLSYDYWVHGKKTLDELHNRPVIFDMIYEWTRTSHRKGGAVAEPAGFNVLFGDGHVVFNTDDRLFDKYLWNGPPFVFGNGPGDNRPLFDVLISYLKP